MKDLATKIHHIAERIEMESLSRYQVRQIVREEFNVSDDPQIDNIERQIWDEHNRVFESAA